MSTFLLNLADRFKNIGATAAYGEPVTADGETLIPVAVVAFGFGGGDAGLEPESGSAPGAEGSRGSGGGGGGMSLPIGAYRRTGGGWRFDPNVIALLSVATPFVWVAGRAIARVIRAAKK